MKNKDFREIQVSSSLLVVIFLGVLALGVFIFLLGVSVGKKQAGGAVPTQIVTQQIPEPVKEPAIKPSSTETALGTARDAGTLPAAPVSAPAAEEPAPKPAAKETTAAPKTTAAKPPAEVKKPATGLYYVQVAAFTDRAQAQAAADRYKKQGYAAVVAGPKPTDAKTWYRVRLGGYASRDKAVDLLGKLNTAAGKKTDFRVIQD